MANVFILHVLNGILFKIFHAKVYLFSSSRSQDAFDDALSTGVADNDDAPRKEH